MIHKWTVTSLKTLEELLENWVNTINWDLWLPKQNIKDMSHLSKYNYSVDWLVNIYGNKLKNLVWLPKSCNELNCGNMKTLVSLSWSPQTSFVNCMETSIINFEWIHPNSTVRPLHINSSYCYKLTSLKWLPKNFNDLNIQWCTSLIDLTDLPDHLTWDIDFSNCWLKSLAFLIWKNIEGSLSFYWNKFWFVSKISRGIYSWEWKQYLFKKKFTVDRVNELFISNPNNLNTWDFKLHLNILRKFLGSAKEIKLIDDQNVEIWNKIYKKKWIWIN